MLPLIVREVASDTVVNLLHEDGDVAVWWGTWVECAVAISRLERENLLDEEGEKGSRNRLGLLGDNWRQARPTDDLRLLASIISKYHPLKAADCLQLAAALRWCEGDTDEANFVCLDQRLRQAASYEGFEVLPLEDAA